MSKPWTQEEKEYLCSCWGSKSLAAICRKLGRSESAVNIKVRRWGLGKFLEQGDYITMHQLLQAVTGSKASDTYKMISWVKNRGFPVRVKRVNTCSFKVVYLDEFWKWAEKNRGFIDFRKFEKNALGKEPDWVEHQRRIDSETATRYKNTPWTTEEDNRLKMYLKMHKFGYAELSEILKRSNGAIQRRVCDLGLKERPVKADNHTPWTDEEMRIVIESIRRGIPLAMVAHQIDRSEKAIRGKLGREYGTESLEKLIKIINRLEELINE